jgi:Tfp pilus assembly protein PilF
MKNLLKLLPIILLMASVPIAAAQTTTPPEFVVQTTSTGIIQLSARKFERGEYRQAAGIALQATRRGLSSGRRSAAWSNLCAARAMQGQYVEAIEACETALEARASWQANNNYGAVLFLAERYADSEQAFASAMQLAPNEIVIAENRARVSSRTLASAQ